MNATKQLWQTVSRESLEDFYKMLEEYTLDPTFLNYGGYLTKYDHTEYSPKASEEFINTIKEKEAKNMYRLFGNFYEVSHGLGDIPDLTEGQAEECQKRLDAHIKTDRFQKALHERFNGIVIEKTNYYNYCVGFADTWYLSHEMTEPMSIESDWSDVLKVREHAEKVDVKSKKKGFVKSTYKVKYVERFFRNSEENNEFIKYVDSKNLPVSAVKYQHKRMTGEESYFNQAEDFTFKSTGRKIKLHLSSYFSHFYEVEDPKGSYKVAE